MLQHTFGQGPGGFHVLRIVPEDEACNGVEVAWRRATHTSRVGASSVIMAGGGEVRFQNVYRLRRWLPSPVSRTYASPDFSSHNPSG